MEKTCFDHNFSRQIESFKISLKYRYRTFLAEMSDQLFLPSYSVTNILLCTVAENVNLGM